MKVSIDKLENQLPETVYLPGEQLFDGGAVTGLREVEKNLWVAQVNGHEVEVFQIRGKTRQVSCECSEFRKNGLCPHLVAALLSLRRELAQEAIPVPKAVKPRKTSKKLTVSAILDAASLEELRDFIAAYARKDQQFTTALKARFAARVDHLDLSEKYNTLLNTLIRSNQSANLIIHKQGARKILETLELLLEQSERELSRGNFAEVFETARSIIDRGPALLPRMQVGRGELTTVIERAYQNLVLLLNEPVPPSLKRRIGEFALDILKGRSFLFSRLDQAYYRLLMRLRELPDSGKATLDLLEKEQGRSFHNKELELRIQLYYFSLNQQSPRGVPAKKAEQLLAERPGVLLDFLQLAFDWGLNSLCEALAAPLTGRTQNDTLRNRLEEILYQVARRENKKKAIRELGQKRLLQSGDPAYLEQLKMFLKKPEDCRPLMEKLRGSTGDTARLRLLAELYSHFGMYAELMDLIEHRNQLELFIQYLPGLNGYAPERTSRLAWQLIREFLSDHLGRPASLKIRNFLHQIRLKGQTDLATGLTEQLVREYGDRPSFEDLLKSIKPR